MAKNKQQTTVFFCQECGYESAKWFGQCPACKSWNTAVEETVKSNKTGGLGGSSQAVLHKDKKSVPTPVSEVKAGDEIRSDTGMAELNRVLGGGLVSGSLILVGGDPGIGKSTLLLQVCRNLSAGGKKVLYVSGEESLQQIRMRADRLGTFSENLLLLCETELSEVESAIETVKPEVVVIDSIQTMFNAEISSAPGSVSQVRETTARLLQVAKGLNTAVFIVGHVTKEGTVAGPRVLEHMVDTVLYFEGDRFASYRILRSVKNRFGSTNEIGVFEMRGDGLTEVANPSEFMLEGRPEHASGCVVACSMEGSRPILTEIQALVTRTNFGFPKRQATGTDFNRVSLLMAVLEKRLDLQIGDCDAYVNLAGGMKVQEPAMDLGIVLALISSFRNKPIDDKLTCFGEVGLSGEVRAVSQAEGRIREAAKLGFTTVILPAACMKGLGEIKGVKLIPVKTLADAMNVI